MTAKTKNFNIQTDPKLECCCGHPECDERSVNQETLDKVQLIRDDYGEPMIVISGGRCPNHPDERRKMRPGDHQKCMTVDITCTNALNRNKLMVLAGRHGATRVAWSKYSIHMSWTETDDRSVPTWLYS